ncbi:MAG: sugar phosphate isomerase/epimerase [Chloroflexota bacterium]
MLKKDNIAVQLYSVREAMQADFEGTIRKLADFGYRALEVATLPESVSPKQAKALFDELGITVTSAHSPLPTRDTATEVIDTLRTLGSPYLVCPWLDPDPYFADLDGVKKACNLLNEAYATVQAHGLTLAYHNHWFEMNIIDGKPAYQHMLELLEPAIVFELDVYWTQVGGQAIQSVMIDLEGRLPLLHVKDGPADKIESNMTAVGDGVLDMPAVLSASTSDWHIVELDRCSTDMLEAIEKSYNYLVAQSEQGA